MAKLLLGKEVTEALNERIRARAEALRAKGIVPKLAIIRCGEDPSEQAYLFFRVRSVLSWCEDLRHNIRDRRSQQFRSPP